MLCTQLMLQFWKVIETLGGRAYIAKGGHWGLVFRDMIAYLACPLISFRIAMETNFWEHP